MSVRRSVGRSVCLFTSSLWSRISLFRGLQRLITAPAQPHATDIAVYPALLNSWRNCQYSTLFSPKQYIVTTLQDDLSLPLSSPTEPNVFLKRAKGVKRNIIKETLTYNHYASLARENIQCPSSKQYSLARKNFTIFMTQNRKVMLSKQNNKRLFYDCMKTPSHHFSLPLDAKYLLDRPKDEIWQNAIFFFCYFSCLFLLQFFSL